MLQFTVDNSPVKDYMEATKLRIFAAISSGMKEGVEGLANTVVDKAFGESIVSRSGQFVGAVLGSQKVRETEAYISGTVSGMVNGKPMGVWFDEGISVPEVRGDLFQVAPADGESFWTHGHAAFQVAPHPIMNVSLQQYGPTLIELIAARVAEATNVDL